MSEAVVVVRDAVEEVDDDEGNWLIVTDGLKFWGWGIFLDESSLFGSLVWRGAGILRLIIFFPLISLRLAPDFPGPGMPVRTGFWLFIWN